MDRFWHQLWVNFHYLWSGAVRRRFKMANLWCTICAVLTLFLQDNTIFWATYVQICNQAQFGQTLNPEASLFSIFNECKRSLGQGNVFTHLYNSGVVGVLPRERGCFWRGLNPGEVLPPEGGVCIQGRGLTMGRSASRGVCIQGVGQAPLRYMGYYGIWPTSGWYASYWNAFLY